MINPITNSDTDEFFHWYLIIPMNDFIGNPENMLKNPVIARLHRTIEIPPELFSLGNIYRRCINLDALKSYIDKK